MKATIEKSRRVRSTLSVAFTLFFSGATKFFTIFFVFFFIWCRFRREMLNIAFSAGEWLLEQEVTGETCRTENDEDMTTFSNNWAVILDACF